MSSDEDSNPSNEDGVGLMVQRVNAANTGISVGRQDSKFKAESSDKGSLPVQHALGLAAQPIAQSMAILVQDSTDLFRNIATVETTAIGTATAKWIAEPPNVAYKEIIDTSKTVIQDMAKIVEQVGKISAGVLAEYEKNES